MKSILAHLFSGRLASGFRRSMVVVLDCTSHVGTNAWAISGSRFARLAPIAFSLAVATGILEAQSQQAVSQRRAVGVIYAIRGPAYLRQSADGRPIQLDPRTDRFRGLREGESVRCGQGGFLELVISGKTIKIKESKDWIPIRAVPSASPEVVKAIDSYGHVGGRDRMIASAIFSPTPGNAVRAKWLEFRWRPAPTLGPVTLVIEDAAGHQVWRQQGIDGASGHFTSEAARKALANYRNAKQELSLTMLDTGKNETRLYFNLLSSQDEEALDRDLRTWKKDGKRLIDYIGRAYVLDHYRLCAEVAQEYESALTLAPESHDLILATIQAQSCTGNLARMNELKRRLSLGVESRQ